MSSGDHTVRSNNFNLIRMILASLVIVGHSPELIDGNRNREPVAAFFHSGHSLGNLAIFGFFLLSGYLIAQSWTRQPKFGPYLLRRVRRIYPGYVMACLVSCLCIAPFGKNPDYWHDFTVGPFVLGMLRLSLPVVPPAFVTLTNVDANAALWTISREFACYFGLAFLGMAGLFARRGFVLALAIASTVWMLAQGCDWVPPLRIHDSPIIATYFLTGVSFFLYRDKVRYTRPAVVASVVILFLAMFRYKSSSLALPWLGGYLLLAFAFAKPVPGMGLVRREDVSYGTYLYAWPIQELIITYWRGINPWLLSAIVLPIAIAAGWLSWRFIEGPAMRWKRRSEIAPEVATAAQQQDYSGSGSNRS